MTWMDATPGMFVKLKCGCSGTLVKVEPSRFLIKITNGTCDVFRSAGESFTHFDSWENPINVEPCHLSEALKRVEKE